MMKIYIGADHGGFEMKEEIKKWLIEHSYEVEDCGNTVFDSDDDYPDFAFPVAEKVANSNETAKGLLICRSGGGVVISANKVKGVRAVDVFDQKSVLHARSHNNANIISVGGDWVSIAEAKEIIKTFLETEFKNEERHVRRIKKISDYENSH